MQPELLPPEANAAARPPELKLRLLPLTLIYVTGILGAVGIIVCGAVILEAVTAIAVFVLIAALILLMIPVLFLAAHRKQF